MTTTTRYYLPRSGTAPTTPVTDPFWTAEIPSTQSVFTLATAKIPGDAVGANAFSPPGPTTTSRQARLSTYVLDLVAGPTPLSFQFAAPFSGSANGHATPSLRVRVVNAANTATSALLFSGLAPGGEVVAATSLSDHRSRTISAALAAYTASVGERLVVDVGMLILNPNGISRHTSVALGTVGTDCVFADGEIGASVPWIEFDEPSSSRVHLGSTLASTMYLGSTQVSKAYLGSTQIL